ncbi:MAG: glycerol-3-phosphate acyltransferase [Cyanobacteria bacterium J06627_32]
MAQVFGALLIFTLIPALGALPLTGWLVTLLTGKQLKQLGTGNVGVSAAFYHGGTLVGLLSVVAEALKGILAVLLARYFFGNDGVWPVMSLMFLVMGRYWGSQGAGTTNIAWGFLVYDPIVTGLIFLISLVSFTVLRMRQQGRLFVLVLMPVLTALRYPADGMRVLAVACLSGLVAWIYHKIPDDLSLPVTQSDGQSRRMFRFFQGDRALPSLSSQVLSAQKVGPKAATLSQLHAWGYPVPPGYVLPAGDDPTALIKAVFPNADLRTDSGREMAVVARSSAVGEDTLSASAAGQYVSVTEISSPEALERAVNACLNAYSAPSAVRYRQDRGIPEGRMNVLVQPHIFGVFSGVAFSRDPVAQAGDAVVVEVLPGEASRVVSGQVTPERYRVSVGELPDSAPWQLPEDMDLPIQPLGTAAQRQTLPKHLIAQVAYLARHIEGRFHGIPQDIEWTFDGEQLWVLQSRPVTTLMPIWTRKIAAEVIPGVIRPLTWSINQPLTCGVWGDLFTTVLKGRAAGLDFSQTATLHYARAYFNATLLGDIFTRMGLPPDSLEFLTRGAKFQRPPLLTTLQNLPGLLRLWRRENSLPRRFAQAERSDFAPALSEWQTQPVSGLSEEAIAARIDRILALLEQATYFNILGPLSLALRQAVLQVDLASLDSRCNPEMQALEDLKKMAAQLRSRLPELGSELEPELGSEPSPADSVPKPSPKSSRANAAHQPPNNSASLFAALSEHPEGHFVFDQLDAFLNRYGYLSEVATDIAVPTWKESPQPVRELLTQFLLSSEVKGPKVKGPAGHSADEKSESAGKPSPAQWKQRQVQARLDLKGRVAEVYNRLLAQLRACFVELESRWLSAGLLESQGDIFFLTLPDIQRQISPRANATPVPESGPGSGPESRLESGPESGPESSLPLAASELRLKVQLAKTQWQQQAERRVPYLVYGKSAPAVVPEPAMLPSTSGKLQGIGASAGQVEGTVRVIETLTDVLSDINSQTILVVPYTDAGWSPLLARIGGLIAEVGGQLSHGAIVAREYGIPAVMDVTDATQRLATGQRVRIDGQLGTIEIL